MDDASSRFQIPWELGVFDAHCHPTDTMSSISSIDAMQTRTLTIMATRAEDQDLVADVARQYGAASATTDPDQNGRIVPSFGWHPWFSHLLYDDRNSTPADRADDPKEKHYNKVLTPTPVAKQFLDALPDPYPLQQFLQHTRQRLQKFPLALVGEIGLDKAFRLPMMAVTNDSMSSDPDLTPGGREGRPLSPYRVCLDHQKIIFMAQLDLAGEMKRPVSVHGVQAHGVIFDTFKETWKGFENKIMSNRERKRRSSVPDAHEYDNFNDPLEPKSSRPFSPRICLHSFSGSRELLRDYFNPRIPARVFFSFSSVINFPRTMTEKTIEVMQAVPEHCLLVETDLNSAGRKMDENLQHAVLKLCELRGWSPVQGVKILNKNWHEFIFGQILNEELDVTDSLSNTIPASEAHSTSHTN